MIARRYMHDYGATSEDFGRVTVADRRHAAANPAAWFYQRPVTLAEHQASRWIAEPLRLLDCCQESDGAVALVVTSAGAGPRPAAAARGDPRRRAGQRPGPVRDDQLLPRRAAGCPRWAWWPGSCGGRPGSARSDVRTAVLYDHFTPYVLLQLEELGFCPRGEARHFIADGAIELGGRLPVNPHGGQLGEAYIHGMNGIAEGGTPGPRHLGQPGPRRRPGPGHRRHRRPHQRAGPFFSLTRWRRGRGGGQVQGGDVAERHRGPIVAPAPA